MSLSIVFLLFICSFLLYGRTFTCAIRTQSSIAIVGRCYCSCSMIANNRISGMILFLLSHSLSLSLFLNLFFYALCSFYSSVWCIVNMKYEILNAVSANLLFFYCYRSSKQKKGVYRFFYLSHDT